MTKKNKDLIDSKIVKLLMADNYGAWMELLAGNAPTGEATTQETFVDVLWQHMVDEPLKLAKDEHWDVLLTAWTGAEGHSEGSAIGRWIHLLELQKPMDKHLKGLPSGEFEIYRGGYAWGLSWTLDKKKAKWFANRKGSYDPIYNPNPTKQPVSALKITKADVIFYLGDDHEYGKEVGDGEKEVVIIPEKANELRMMI